MNKNTLTFNIYNFSGKTKLEFFYNARRLSPILFSRLYHSEVSDRTNFSSFSPTHNNSLDYLLCWIVCSELFILLPQTEKAIEKRLVGGCNNVSSEKGPLKVLPNWLYFLFRVAFRPQLTITKLDTLWMLKQLKLDCLLCNSCLTF